MNFMLMTLPHKVSPSADLATQQSYIGESHAKCPASDTSKVISLASKKMLQLRSLLLDADVD